ncbi:MAG TPA: diguanylate cyclase [Acidobacteriota bacterium]|nr:diguanylate cyclase [Acidobacteriota bacterium]
MKERVLLVDPSSVLPESLDRLLTERGYEPQRIGEFREALHTAGIDHYPLLFLGLDGQSRPAELIGRLKARVRVPCHILAVGPNDVPTAVNAIQSGARHYYTAPLNLADLEKDLVSGQFVHSDVSPRYQREGTLLQIIKEIALTMELDGLVNILMDSAMELTDADGGSILIHDDRTNSLMMKAIRGLSGNENRPAYFGLDEARFQEILNGRTPVFLHPEEPLTASEDLKVSALIAAPIWWRDEPLGLLVTVRFAGAEPLFSNDDFKLLSLLVDEIAGAVFNAVTHYRTKELTIKDDLTDAYNRRYFERYLEEEFMRARRYGSNLSLIFFDVDNLKEVNLRFGHLIGSKTLQEVAHRMILTVRGIDKVVRYGGDEFCVVLPETDTQGAYQVAERIRVIMASKPFMINDNIPVTITGSIGIASYPMHAVSKDELVRAADKAMFAIKNRTKNAIGVAETLAH